MKLTLILAALMATSIFAFGQETNAPSQKPLDRSLSYEKRVEHGFGQLQEPRWAGQKPGWMRQGEQGPRGPMSPQFRGGQQGPKGPMFRGGQQGGPRGPMMGQGRGPGGPKGQGLHQGRGPQFRGGFREEGAIQRGCPLCEKHKKMVSKKHAAKQGGKSRQGEPRHQKLVK